MANGDYPRFIRATQNYLQSMPGAAMTLRTPYDEAAAAARAEAETEAAQQRHDFNRGASPITDGPETIARIEAAMGTASERDRRMLERELWRLRAAHGYAPTMAAAAE